MEIKKRYYYRQSIVINTLRFYKNDVYKKDRLEIPNKENSKNVARLTNHTLKKL